MNILILGNGFDLAHGLPTKYRDFLTFTNAFKDFYKDHGLTEDSSKDAERFTPYFEKLQWHHTSIYNELKCLIEKNVWLKHFNAVYEQRMQYGKEGWIDFESEISRSIQALEGALKILKEYKKNGKGLGKIAPDQFEDLRYLVNNLECKKNTILFLLEDLLEYKNIFLQDLNRLTRCLEIYLSDYINNLPIKKSLPDIKALEIDKVLSFNYTNTYERLYGKDNSDIEYDYIHGKAKITNDISNCNIVLGIDEYLVGDERNNNTEFIQFKKFFQRIYKKTGNKYVDWLKEFEKNVSKKRADLEPETLNIYIFGHSLDVTDKDILRRLILGETGQISINNENIIHTIIFHYNQNALGSQITNLVKVIGQDNLISMVHGSDANIHLLTQRNAVEM